MKKSDAISLILSVLLVALGLYQIFFITIPVNPKVLGVIVILYGFYGIVWYLEKQNVLKIKNR